MLMHALQLDAPHVVFLQVSKGSLLTGKTAGDRPLLSRLGRSQPSSPTAAFPAAATASQVDALFAVDTSQLRDAPPPSTLHNVTSAAGMRMPLTQLRQPQQQQQQRTSLGSNISSTPAGLLISPGVAALASKYATSSVGGSSVGALSLPEQQSTGRWAQSMPMGASRCGVWIIRSLPQEAWALLGCSPADGWQPGCSCCCCCCCCCCCQQVNTMRPWFHKRHCAQ
jgi:hypothetical protein